MNIRIMLFIAALLPFYAFADKGDFTFKVGDSITAIPSSCVESISYDGKDEIVSESLYVSLTTECGQLLYQGTRESIGKMARFSYRDNLISSVVITSAIRSSFRISSKEIPRTVLMQMLSDYGAESE
ncbi:Insecticidal toxin complex protein tccz [Kosakonia sp. H7A]|uniref:Insecticidal toxin complex protein tccz n=1 Tax=Kosakonia sp. H7A TaxID=2054598 RepID=UPI000D155583|nr:Insecticidal toxin complex protein tccz [Kosakonia sp. H7A]PTA92882.1 Insecticidal toxin complex protein tccz [Kosakonia sp. H7A]